METLDLKKDQNIHKRKRRLEHWQKITVILILYDILAVNSSYFLALWFRFDCRFSAIEPLYLNSWRKFTPFYTVFCILVFWLLRLYKSVWQYVSYTEFYRVAVSSVITTAFHVVCVSAWIGRMPVSYYIMGMVFQFLFVLAARFGYRFILLLFGNRASGKNDGKVSRVMLIGAGNSGQMIIRDIHRAKEVTDKVCCVIDDNRNKWGRYIEGIPVVGGRDEIFSAVHKYQIDKIYLAIPSATAAQKRDILNICNETGCELKQLPGMYQLVNGEVTASSLRKVSVEDLLGREPIRSDLTEVFHFIQGKTVLVTGAGGSIGSELVRQIASHSPKMLVLLDIYENSLYSVQLELKDRYPDLQFAALVGSVRDSRRLFQIFEEYRPQVVYHAAAHKHVPLMEDSPCEAVKNNAIGTYKTAYAAMLHGCERFVLISTDKAVNPTNVMGASKRLCEMIIQGFDAKIRAGKAAEIPQLFTHRGQENAGRDGTEEAFRKIKTEFVAVRFGNVLGSNGSVIPIFREQIAKGGPVTVTHPDIIRYFMTIPEAVSLVLLAGTKARGGEIFVLDMGSPVKIDTLARNMIRLSGYRPDVDIKIEYVGLRPGEKLYEEKLMAEEGLRTTDNALIHIGSPIPFDTDEFFAQLRGLMDAAYANKPDIRERIRRIVTTYHPSDTEGINEEIGKKSGKKESGGK